MTHRQLAQWKRAGLVTWRFQDLLLIERILFLRYFAPSYPYSSGDTLSNMAQWKRAGLITRRSQDRNLILLKERILSVQIFLAPSFLLAVECWKEHFLVSFVSSSSKARVTISQRKELSWCSTSSL
jgi:hypothetical protein